MFVNSVPFLVLASRNLNLITIEHAPQQTASKIAYLLQRIVRVYNRAGFTVQTILMDNEFEKVRNHLPAINLNLPAAREHVAEIERQIRVIKERSRGIINTLPYPHLLQMMLIHLLHFVVMWLNNFPSNTGISSRWSPRKIVYAIALTTSTTAAPPSEPTAKSMKITRRKETPLRPAVSHPYALDLPGTSRAPIIFKSGFWSCFEKENME